jgi:hypothetical protein
MILRVLALRTPSHPCQSPVESACIITSQHFLLSYNDILHTAQYPTSYYDSNFTSYIPFLAFPSLIKMPLDQEQLSR